MPVQGMLWHWNAAQGAITSISLEIRFGPADAAARVSLSTTTGARCEGGIDQYSALTQPGGHDVIHDVDSIPGFGWPPIVSAPLMTGVTADFIVFPSVGSFPGTDYGVMTLIVWIWS